MQRFFGMINFYRRFLPVVAGTLRPLTAALSGNPKTLPCTPFMETAFAAAKAALVAAVPLAHPLPRAVLALATDTSDTHVGAVLQQQVGQHWQPLGFFSKKLFKSEVNYSTFDRELLPAVSCIKHFLSRLEGHPFQLWTEHKPLIFALHRVSPPTSGRKQRHLAFISEYTWWRMRCPARRPLPPEPPGTAQPLPTGCPWISRTWLSARSSAHRYNLSAPAWGCTSSHRRSATSTSSATHPLELSARWCPGTFGDRFSNISTGPPTLAGRRPAASSPPGTYGKVSPQMSPPGQRPAWAASGPRSTATFRYPLKTSPYPPAFSDTSTWTWWAP
jgi:hypothetical protein